MITSGLIAVALVQLRRERELVRLRTDFVSGISHELRTPLAQIRMFGETLLLNRVRSAEEHRRSLEIIVPESQRLTHLIENVLQFARADRGATKVTAKPERLDVLRHDIIDGFEPLARSKRASIARQIDHDTVAPIDAGATRQIVLNLLDNAVKYGPPEQTIVVRCGCDHGVATIAVEDEGPGVPDADTARIWDPFLSVLPNCSRRCDGRHWDRPGDRATSRRDAGRTSPRGARGTRRALRHRATQRHAGARRRRSSHCVRRSLT